MNAVPLAKAHSFSCLDERLVRSSVGQIDLNTKEETMGAAILRVKFDGPSPTIERVAARFRELTGIELVVDKADGTPYVLVAPPLKGDVEFSYGGGVQLVMFRLRVLRGYLEWALVWTLRDLGGQIPLRAVPAYARVPWSSLSWYARWRHR